MRPRMLPDGLIKHGAVIHLTEEQLFDALSYTDSRYLRKAKKKEYPPSASARKRYRRALEGLRALEAYEGTEWGGPDYGTEVNPPEPVIKYDYLETHDEWMARCRELRKETP